LRAALLPMVGFSWQLAMGQTCLFKCLNYLRPEKSVNEYINDFDSTIGHHQHIYLDGATATVKETIGFIIREVDTVDIRYKGMFPALHDHCYILTTIRVTDENGNKCDHAIVLTKYRGDIRQLARVRLWYYDPAAGGIENMSYCDWLEQEPHYLIAVRIK